MKVTFAAAFDENKETKFHRKMAETSTYVYDFEMESVNISVRCPHLLLNNTLPGKTSFFVCMTIVVKNGTNI